jgi:hypothetical protein
MGALGNLSRRIIESVEERTGREIVPRDRMEVLESFESDNRVMRKMLDFIGFTLFNYQGAQPSPYRMPNDMLPQARIFFAAQALRAWMDDPTAGQQVDLYVSFVFGRGVPRGAAHDEDVQDVLDRAWNDEANKRVLTSFASLTEKGVDLALQSNVYWTVFDDGMDGMARLSMLDFEDVLDVVRHPVDKYRILYYKVTERTVEYDFTRDAYVTPTGEKGQPAIVYHEKFGAFNKDDPVMAAQDQQATLPTPPAPRLREGKVIHLAVNKTSKMAFGVPRFRRLMRWFTAYNEVLESHVNRMKAAASIYMKQTAKGDQRKLDQLAQMATGRPSRFAEAEEIDPHGRHHMPPGPVNPGILQQNESLNHEPFKIDSGASDVAASVPQLRAQASGIFPPTYYGQDAGSLAGQQTVELPVLKFIEREQEQWVNDVFRPFAQANIDAAIRNGDLSEWRDPTEEEVQRIEAHQNEGTPLDGLELDSQTGQVKRDFGFEITLPSPLKRAMGDLVSAAVEIAAAVDPMGQNPEVSRWLFGFALAEAFDVEDPQRIVDQVLPRHVAEQLAGGQGEIDPETGQPRPTPNQEQATATGPDGKQHPAGNPYGARVRSPNPEQRTVAEHAVRGRGARRLRLAATHDRDRTIDDAFADVTETTAAHLRHLGNVPALAGSTNGGDPNHGQ